MHAHAGRRQLRTRAPGGQLVFEREMTDGQWCGECRRKGRGRGGLPFVAQEHVVEIVVDDEQLLCQLLVGDPGDELQDPLLHGSACPVELLPRKQARQLWPLGPERGRLQRVGSGLWGCLGGPRGFQTGVQAPQNSFRGSKSEPLNLTSQCSDT